MQLFTHLLSSYLQGMGDFFSALGKNWEVAPVGTPVLHTRPHIMQERRQLLFGIAGAYGYVSATD